MDVQGSREEPHPRMLPSTLALTVPLLLVLLTSKALVVSHWDQTAGVDRDKLISFFLIDSSLARLMGFGLIGLALGLWLKRRIWWAGLAGFGAGIVLAVAAMAARMWISGRPASASGILHGAVAESMNALKIAWEDLVFAGTFALFAFALLWVTARHFRRAGTVVVVVVWLALLTLIGWELAYYFKTGGTGSGQLLAYVIEQRAHLGGIVASELDREMVIAMLGPYLAIPLAWRLWSRWRTPGTHDTQSSGPRVQSTPLRHYPELAHALRLAFGVGLLFAAGMALPVQPPSTHYSRFAANTFFTIGRDLFGDSAQAIPPRDVMRKALELAPFADVHNIRLVSNRNSKRLNAIVIMMESVRADKTSVHSADLATTPFLRELSERGVMVENMNAVLPRTANAWISVLTGTHGADLLGVADWVRSNKEPKFNSSLARLLRPLGYKSAFFTPTHLDVESDRAVVTGLGFDKVSIDVDLDAKAWERPTSWGLEDRAMLEPALRWIKERRDAKESSLAVIMTNIGHTPYKMPSSWPAVDFPGVTNPQLENYLNCLRYIDQWTRELFDGLRAMGALDDTVIVILGDHGESFGERGGERMHLKVLNREVTHVPAVIVAPNLAPARIRGYRQQTDVLPTLAELLGLEIEGGYLPGRSLLAPGVPGRQAFHATHQPQTLLATHREGRKFIYNFGRTPMQVYDTASDPWELRDIAASIPKRELDDAEAEMLIWSARTRLDMVQPAHP